MTIPEICLLMSKTIPEKFTEIAKHLASLDNQTALEIIRKYNNDMKMSQQKLSDEIRKQTIRGLKIK